MEREVKNIIDYGVYTREMESYIKAIKKQKQKLN